MREVPREDLLTVIGCEIERRPDAPTLVDIEPLATSVRRAAGTLVIEFTEGALGLVEAFAAAERQCCSGLGWSVEAGPPVTLRISAPQAALDTMQKMFLAKEHIEAHQ